MRAHDVELRSSCSVARTSASRARWVMKIRRAEPSAAPSAPSTVSCSIERIDTSWAPKTPATAASTPGRSRTSRLM